MGKLRMANWKCCLKPCTIHDHFDWLCLLFLTQSKTWNAAELRDGFDCAVELVGSVFEGDLLSRAVLGLRDTFLGGSNGDGRDVFSISEAGTVCHSCGIAGFSGASTGLSGTSRTGCSKIMF